MEAADSLSAMMEAVKRFHEKHGFDVGTESTETMLYRMNILMEEIGEISQCLTKGKGNIAEEHADVFILLLGNCLTMNIDLGAEFWKKYEKIMLRSSRRLENICALPITKENK